MVKMYKIHNNESGFSAIVITLAVVVLVSLGAIGWFVYHNHQMKVINYTYRTSNGDAKFTGIVTKNCSDSSLPAGDVGCYIQVGTVSVYIGGGNARQIGPLGIVRKGGDAHGQKVEVYAHKLDANDFTLEGSSKFYIKPLN